MNDAINMPNDVKSCHELILSQQEKLASQQKQIDELEAEQRKLQKLLSQLVNGNRSEKRVFFFSVQTLLPFESEEEYQAAQAEAEAEAEEVIQRYTVERRLRKKKPRNESLPSHLPRVEEIVDAPDEMKICPQHGERKIIGYDITETLMREPPRLWVLRKKYPKFACADEPSCGAVAPLSAP